MPTQRNTPVGSIAEVSIEGFRSLKRVENLKLPQLTVLIGANGVGKSSFIRFFEMLSWMLRSRNLQEFILRKGGGDDQFFIKTSARKPPCLEGGGSAVLSLCVSITVDFLKDTTVFVTDALDGCVDSFDVKTSRASDGDSSDVSTRLFSERNDGFDEIARLESKVALLSRFGFRPRETVLIHSTHLSRTSPHCPNL